jgi:hypothetical protein
VVEEMVAAIRELTAAVGAVKTTVNNSKVILKDMVAWKPQVNGAILEMHADITVLRQQLGRVSLNPILGLDPEALWTHIAPSPSKGADEKGVHGNDGHGPGGHRVDLQPRS